jgi:hypothetical protein
MIGKDVEGSGRGLTYSIIQAFAWRDWRKPQKRSCSIAGLRAEI